MLLFGVCKLFFWFMLLWVKLILLPGYLFLKVTGFLAKIIFNIGVMAAGITLGLLIGGLAVGIIMGNIIICILSVSLLIGVADVYLGVLIDLISTLLFWW